MIWKIIKLMIYLVKKEKKTEKLKKLHKEVFKTLIKFKKIFT